MTPQIVSPFFWTAAISIALRLLDNVAVETDNQVRGVPISTLVNMVSTLHKEGVLGCGELSAYLSKATPDEIRLVGQSVTEIMSHLTSSSLQETSELTIQSLGPYIRIT